MIRDRLAGRQGDASDAGLAIYEEIAQRWEPLSPATRDVTRLIDTGASLALSATAALDALREFGLWDGAV